VDAGHPGDPTIVVRVPTVVADTKAVAERRAEDLMKLARKYYAGRQGIGSTDAGSASPDTTEEVNMFGTPEEIIEKVHIFREAFSTEVNMFGTPEEIIEKVHIFREAFSTDEIMFECNWTSSVPRDVIMDTIRCISDKVIPAFK
jgi:alkanesulfonate monooxygenase SsuD/methylene tetrahydromethanopterin reductase-like flavin-dependent oxidoreductase (luciferase family)